MKFVKTSRTLFPLEGNYEFCPACGSKNICKGEVIKQVKYHLQVYFCNDCTKTSMQRISSGPKKKAPLVPHPVHDKGFSWKAYNDAQMNEKLLFLDILWELCCHIPKRELVLKGRPSMDMREMLFCMVCKCYEGLSSRRVSSDLELAYRRGYISKVPHFTTLLKYYNNPCFVAVLYDLVRLSAIPLREFESTFAIDATGLSPGMYSRWLDHRMDKKTKGWLKVHAICGIKSNIITSLVISDGLRNDCPLFPELVSKTSSNFRIKEILADKAYLSRPNMELAFSVGAIPYIPFRTNCNFSRRGSSAWSKMFHYFKYNQEDFLSRYHLRSNVESAFSSLKRKFSPKLMFRNELSQTNEALSKALCYNICILVSESFKMGFSVEDKLRKVKIKSDGIVMCWE